MTTFMFAGMIIGAAAGLAVAHPSMNLPAYTGFKNASMGDMFPILFVTVACGAVSGFHSLVSSGTSSKTISNEKDMLKVGYEQWFWKVFWQFWPCVWQALLQEQTERLLWVLPSRSFQPVWQDFWKCLESLCM